MQSFIQHKRWDLLVKNYSAKEICSELTFQEAMFLVNDIFYSDLQDDELQQFALKLIFEIKNYFKDQWEADWKNDVFLGRLCAVLWRYEEEYIYYKSAYDKLSDPPESLLLLLAGCDSPETASISQEESENYVTRAIKKKVTYEAALIMKSLCRHKADPQTEEYWDKMCNELKQKNIHTDAIVPEIFRDTKIPK